MGKRMLPKGTLRMCVDEEKEGIYSGRIYSRFRKEAVPFGNIGEILLIGEEIFNETGFPMAFQEKRTFVQSSSKERKSREETALTDPELRAFQGKLYTADIIVMTRRRCGWQGFFAGQDGEPRFFESEMQLLDLLLEALHGKTRARSLTLAEESQR